MTVFVDALFEAVAKGEQARRVGARNGHMWCHLIADTDDELHEFAARLGMRREWFQAPPTASHPHYDLTPPRRALAVKLGAHEVDGRTLAQIMRAHRAVRASAFASRIAALRVEEQAERDLAARLTGEPAERARGRATCLAQQRHDLAFRFELLGLHRGQDLHERIAHVLGWTVEQVRGFSLLALRDLVRGFSPKLADEISRQQSTGHVITREDP